MQMMLSSILWCLKWSVLWLLRAVPLTKLEVCVCERVYGSTEIWMQVEWKNLRQLANCSKKFTLVCKLSVTCKAGSRAKLSGWQYYNILSPVLLFSVISSTVSQLKRGDYSISYFERIYCTSLFGAMSCRRLGNLDSGKFLVPVF